MSAISKYEFKELQHRFQANPKDSQLGVKLATAQIAEGQYQEGLDSLQRVTHYSTVDEGTLRTLLSQLQGKVDAKTLINYYHEALEDNYYVGLAKDAAKYLRQSQLPRRVCMISFERLITQFCFDYEEGSRFFQSFRKFELTRLEEANSSQTQARDIKAIDNSIRSIFQRQLRLPSRDIDLTWDQYNQWETNKSEIEKFQLVYKKTSESSQQQGDFEKFFRDSLKGKTKLPMNPLELLQSVYQKYENKELETPKIINFYEIALEALHIQLKSEEDRSQYEEAWNFFRGFLKENTNAQLQLKYLKRASKVVQEKGLVSQLILRCMEQLNKETDVYEQEYQRLVEILDSNSDILNLAKARLWRYTRAYITTPDVQMVVLSILKQQTQIRSYLEQLIQMCSTIEEDQQRETSLIYQTFARVEALLFGNVEVGQKFMEQCVKIHPDLATNWQVYLSIQNGRPFENASQRDKYRGILKRACENVKEDVKPLVTAWLEFEVLFGTVEELIKAEQKFLSVINTEIGAEYDEKSAEEAMDVEDESSESEKKKPSKTKERKQQKDQDSRDQKEPQTLKRKRDADQSVDEPEKKVSTEEGKIYVDSEKTIFVRNIPLDCTEETFINLVENREHLLGCRFVRNTKTNQFKGFAYIDFIDYDQAQKAATQLNQKLIGQNKLYAAVSKPPRIAKDEKLTLYLTNLPFTITEDKIKQKLLEQPTIQISEIRLIKDNDGKPKGYAYLDFEDGVSLSLAQAYFAQGQIIDGRKVFAEKSDNISIIKKRQTMQGVIIKNLSFKARDKHIKELFEGMEINQLIIPRDDHNKPRGFALVDFTYQKDFLKALEMKDATILGRPVEIFKSDREISSNPRERSKPIQTSPEEYTKPKSNTDFRKFL